MQAVYNAARSAPLLEHCSRLLGSHGHHCKLIRVVLLQGLHARYEDVKERSCIAISLLLEERRGEPEAVMAEVSTVSCCSVYMSRRYLGAVDKV